MNAIYETYGTVNHLKRLSNREWGKYDKPFTFNITVQTLEEINNYKKAKNHDCKDHKLVTQDDDKPIVRKRLYDYIRAIFNTTKQGFAKIVGVSPAAVTKWLYTTTMPSTYVLMSISRHTGLDYEEVLDLFSEGT